MGKEAPGDFLHHMNSRDRDSTLTVCSLTASTKSIQLQRSLSLKITINPYLATYLFYVNAYDELTTHTNIK